MKPTLRGPHGKVRGGEGWCYAVKEKKFSELTKMKDNWNKNIEIMCIFSPHVTKFQFTTTSYRH